MPTDQNMSQKSLLRSIDTIVAFGIISRRQSNSTNDVDDLIQETFARLTSSLEFSRAYSKRSYLFKVARSVLMDRRRRRFRRPAEEELTTEPTDFEGFTPEDVLGAKELAERIKAALDCLPRRVRHAFILYRFDRMPQKLIAKQLGVSVSTIEKDLAHALAHLADRLHRFNA